KTVVQFQESFPVPFGAANVRVNDRATQFVDEVIVSGQIPGTLLRLRAAVNLDDNRPLPRKFRSVRFVEKTADLFSVEALPFHQLGFREFFRGDSAGLAGGPTRDRVLAFGGRPNVDVGRRSRAGHVKSEQALLPVAVKLEAENVR